MLKLFYELSELVNNIDKIDDRISFYFQLRKEFITSLRRYQNLREQEFNSEIKSELNSIPELLDLELNRLEVLKKSKNCNVGSDLNTSKQNNVELDTHSNGTDKNENTIFNIETLSKYLGVSKSYIYKMTHRNLIAYSKPGGKRIFFRKDDVDNFLKTNKVKSKSELSEIADKFIVTSRKLQTNVK